MVSLAPPPLLTLLWRASCPVRVRRQQHPLIQVVRDWREVEAALQRLEPELRAKMASSSLAGQQQHQHGAAHQG